MTPPVGNGCFTLQANMADARRPNHQKSPSLCRYGTVPLRFAVSALPRKRTLIGCSWMSALCRQQTSVSASWSEHAHRSFLLAVDNDVCAGSIVPTKCVFLWCRTQQGWPRVIRLFLMIESERLSETDTQETPMRALLGTSIAAVVAVTVWWSLPTHATQQYSDVSINALDMMVTTTNLPRDPQYDQGTVFLSPEAQAQYTQ